MNSLVTIQCLLNEPLLIINSFCSTYLGFAIFDLDVTLSNAVMEFYDYIDVFSLIFII